MQMICKKFAADDTGATAIEYGLIAALITIVVIGSLTSLSSALWNKMNLVATATN
jgi:pilus assembly protein Flp/PilA